MSINGNSRIGRRKLSGAKMPEFVPPPEISAEAQAALERAKARERLRREMRRLALERQRIVAEAKADVIDWLLS